MPECLDLSLRFSALAARFSFKVFAGGVFPDLGFPLFSFDMPLTLKFKPSFGSLAKVSLKLGNDLYRHN